MAFLPHHVCIYAVVPSSTRLGGASDTRACSSVFFFAVRDVYAASIFVAFGLTFVMADRVDGSVAQAAIPAVYGSAFITVLILMRIHLYFVRNFRTIALTK
ncbi:MAG: hypothetical protein WCF90_02270 [Methanomicrobiales archaeon]